MKTAVRIGLLSNGRSRRNRRSLADIGRIADASPNLAHIVLDGVSGLEDALAEFARREVGVLAVNGGDGTVQAVLTVLLGPRSPFPQPPALAVVPGGTTNMTAADVGLRGGRARGLARLLAAMSAGGEGLVATERHVVGVDRGDGGPVQYGMFFGTAGICRAIDYCRRAVHPLKVDSGVASALTLAGLLARLPFRRGEGGGVLAGDRIGVALDGGGETAADRFLLLVTTLDRLVLRSRPFWGGGTGGLRYTSVAWPPRGLLLRAPCVMYGGATRRLPAGTYDSRRAERIALTMDCAYTLDGEMFDPLPGVPLLLQDGGRVAFVRT
ncbi:MAG: diacylglycerol kinase family protein [Alphaproteobacteria bacterium]